MAIQIPQRTQGANPSATLARISQGGGPSVSFEGGGDRGFQGQGLAAGIASAGEAIGAGMEKAADRRFAVAMHKDEQRFAKERDAKQQQYSIAMGMLNYILMEGTRRRKDFVDRGIKHLEYMSANPQLYTDEQISAMQEAVAMHARPLTWRDILNTGNVAASLSGIAPIAPIGAVGAASDGTYESSTPLLSASISDGGGAEGGIGMTDADLDRPIIKDVARAADAALLSSLVPSLGNVADRRAMASLGKQIGKVRLLKAVQAKDMEHQVEALLLHEGGEVAAPDPESKLDSVLEGRDASVALGGIRFTRGEESIRQAVGGLIELAKKGQMPADVTEYLNAAINPVRDSAWAQLQRMALSGDPEWVDFEMAGPSSAVAMSALFDNRSSTLMDLVRENVDETTGKATGSWLDAEMKGASEEEKATVRAALTQAAKQYRNGYYRTSSSWHAYRFPAAQALNDYESEVAIRGLTSPEQLSLFQEKLGGFIGDEGYRRFVEGNRNTTLMKLINSRGPEALRSLIRPEYLDKYDQWELDRTSHPPSAVQRPGQIAQEQPPQGVGAKIGQMTPAQTVGAPLRAARAVGSSYMGAAKDFGAEVKRRANIPWNQQGAEDARRRVIPSDLTGPDIWPSNEDVYGRPGDDLQRALAGQDLESILAQVNRLQGRS